MKKITVTMSTRFGEGIPSIEDEFITFVREASSEEDARHNVRFILKEYEHRKTVGQLLRQLVRKLFT